MKTTMTVGGLRKALEGVDEALPVWVIVEAFVDEEIDSCWATVDVVGARPAGSGGLFSSPPVPHFMIGADGVPENQCRDCGGIDNEHRKICDSRSEVESERKQGE